MGFSMGYIGLKFKLRGEQGLGRKRQRNSVFQYFGLTCRRPLAADDATTPRYRHGRGHFAPSPWSMTTNHGAQAHRASLPNTRWRSPPLVFLRARDPRIRHALRASAIASAAEEAGVRVAAVSPSSRTLHATRLHRRRQRRRGRSATRAYCQSRVCTEP